MPQPVYEIDQQTAASLAEVWVKAGMPDAIAVYDLDQDTVELRDRADVIKHMDAKGLRVPEGLRNVAQFANPPMLMSFWVAVLLPGGVQYARVSALNDSAEA
jgi:hypothetical protein